MSTKQVVKDILDSIQSVKSRVRVALRENRYLDARKLMFDVYALEACLVSESERLIKEIETVEFQAGCSASEFEKIA